MIIKSNLIVNLVINCKEDLYKLRPLAENDLNNINYSALARELGLDRRTVKRYIFGFKKSKKRVKTSGLDEYYVLVKALLFDTSQTFRYKSFLYRYLIDNHELSCSESSFRKWISRNEDFKNYFLEKRAITVANKSIIRFETGKGQQAQLDWKENMTIILKNGELIQINILVCILSYSRFRVYRLSLEKTHSVLFHFLDEMFEAFGGVPEELLTDNMKTVMDVARTHYNKGKVNNKFQAFADDYGFKVRPCLAARPCTKAKVESPMRILDELYGYNGQLTFEELVMQVEKLNNRENTRFHKGSQKIPISHLEKERDSLKQLPSQNIRNPYQIKTTIVKVNNQSLISYKSHYYSVPLKYIGNNVSLQVYDDKLHLYFNKELIALHSITEEVFNYNQHHYKEIIKEGLNNKNIDTERIALDNLKKMRMM